MKKYDDIPGVRIVECRDESIFAKWKDVILHYNPDITDNIFGFDFDCINKMIDYLFPCCAKCKRTKHIQAADDCPKMTFTDLV